MRVVQTVWYSQLPLRLNRNVQQPILFWSIFMYTKTIWCRGLKTDWLECSLLLTARLKMMMLVVFFIVLLRLTTRITRKIDNHNDREKHHYGNDCHENLKVSSLNIIFFSKSFCNLIINFKIIRRFTLIWEVPERRVSIFNFWNLEANVDWNAREALKVSFTGVHQFPRDLFIAWQSY